MGIQEESLVSLPLLSGCLLLTPFCLSSEWAGRWKRKKNSQINVLCPRRTHDRYWPGWCGGAAQLR
jgi:hypothetical protein